MFLIISRCYYYGRLCQWPAEVKAENCCVQVLSLKPDTENLMYWFFNHSREAYGKMFSSVCSYMCLCGLEKGSIKYIAKGKRGTLKKSNKQKRNVCKVYVLNKWFSSIIGCSYTRLLIYTVWQGLQWNCN